MNVSNRDAAAGNSAELCEILANNVLPEQKQLAFRHLVDASEAIALRATFELMAGIDHKEVLRELESAHEALWNREGNQDALLLMIARMLSERSADE